MILRGKWRKYVASFPLTLCASAGANAAVFFAEDFESVTLKPAVNENINFLGWTDTPPTGWTVDDSHIPGALTGDDARDGRTEWAGWSFASKEFWLAADGQRRGEFTKGTGVVAIADPDEWDDQPHDPITDDSNIYSAYMSTPTFNVTGFRPGKLFLKYDSSFRPEGPDDGPAYNDQSPVIRASWNGGASTEILRWTSDPAAARGGTVMRDDNNTNDTIILPLTVPAGATTLQLNFGLERCENDWFWAVDNIFVADALPDFKIIVDSADGDVALVNGSNKTVDLQGYMITSASGSLDLSKWSSLNESGLAGPGWLENSNASNSNLTETNFTGSIVIEPNQGLYLGKIFKIGGTHDLALQAVDAVKPGLQGFVEYDDVNADDYDDPLGGTTLPGDTNGDGKVDLVDLNNVRNNFGGTGLGDTNGDNKVDLDDLNSVRNNFGATSGSSSVPEPSSLALLALSACGLGWIVRRRR